ncbi:MAG: signal peptide peptidase SppA [Pirellulales bacterium]
MDAPSPGYPPSATPIQYVPVPAPPPRRSGWGLLFTLAILAVLGMSLLLNFGLLGAVGMSVEGRTLTEKHHSLSRTALDKIALIRVEGTILEGDGFVKEQIDQVRDDDRVKAIVLRVDSPGGTVTGSDFIYHHLRELAEAKKVPIVVSMGSLAASGGYYVSMAVGDTPKSIYAEPTTWTGSIGVIIPHYNVAGLMQEWKIQSDSISSHPLKGMGSITKEMTPEERAIFQGLVDESFTRFKQIIAAGRPGFRGDDGQAKLDKLATGQVFTSDQAKANGLIDEVGFVEAAISRAVELAGADEASIRVVKYERPVSLVDVLIGGQAQARSFDATALLNLATPKAYYLTTLLPAVLTTQPGRAH